MITGNIYHLCGKFTVRASLGTITFGPRKGAPKGTTVARVLVLPDDATGGALSDWLQERAEEIRKASNAGITGPATQDTTHGK